eukprot:364555-Chlamydomonas_euryale.AAC.12
MARGERLSALKSGLHAHACGGSKIAAARVRAPAWGTASHVFAGAKLSLGFTQAFARQMFHMRMWATLFATIVPSALLAMVKACLRAGCEGRT